MQNDKQLPSKISNPSSKPKIGNLFEVCFDLDSLLTILSSLEFEVLRLFDIM